MKRKKSIAMALILTMLVITIASIVSGCVNLEKEVVIGDFICQEWSDGTINLKDLSEEGKKKKYIVVPEKLNGRKVVMLGYRDAIFSSGGGCWVSAVLKKIYFLGEHHKIISGIFKKCEKLDSIVIINNYNIGLDDYKSEVENIYISATRYNILSEKYEFVNGNFSNLSYFYNYESAPNDGYYWIDDVEDGELIDFIPQDPERDGYKFQGWYKEQECINKWDFDKDRIIKASVDEPYYENKLFAKWAKE